MKAIPIDDLGSISGRVIGAIIGATAMEGEIRIDVAKAELDLPA